MYNLYVLICVTELSFCPFIHLEILKKEMLKDFWDTCTQHSANIWNFGYHLRWHLNSILLHMTNFMEQIPSCQSGSLSDGEEDRCHDMEPDLTQLSTTSWKDVMSLLVLLCLRGWWNSDKYLGKRIIKHCHLICREHDYWLALCSCLMQNETGTSFSSTLLFSGVTAEPPQIY
jgi:hypothetical protein